MFWRILSFVCAITFISTGSSVLSDPNCPYIDFGGTRRQLIFECVAAPVDGGMTQPVAGWLAISGGVVLLLLSIGPFLAAKLAPPEIVSTPMTQPTQPTSPPPPGRNANAGEARRESVKHPQPQQPTTPPPPGTTADETVNRPSDHSREDPDNAPAGWYPDPLEAGQMRFWDGEQWTGRTETPSPPRP